MFRASYEIADIGGEAREVFSNLSGSLGSRYFLNAMMTSFTSSAGTFDKSRIGH